MIVKYTEKEKELLARLMRAEAVGEGNLGMLMVGNVGINRVLADCLTFKDIRSISEMVYQSPGGFSGTSSSLFYGNPTALESSLAELSAENITILQLMPYGFMLRQKEHHVKVLGGINPFLVDTKIIVSISQIKEYVKKYTNVKSTKRIHNRNR